MADDGSSASAARAAAKQFEDEVKVFATEMLVFLVEDCVNNPEHDPTPTPTPPANRLFAKMTETTEPDTESKDKTFLVLKLINPNNARRPSPRFCWVLDGTTASHPASKWFHSKHQLPAEEALTAVCEASLSVVERHTGIRFQVNVGGTFPNRTIEFAPLNQCDMAGLRARLCHQLFPYNSQGGSVHADLVNPLYVSTLALASIVMEHDPMGIACDMVLTVRKQEGKVVATLKVQRNGHVKQMSFPLPPSTSTSSVFDITHLLDSMDFTSFKTYQQTGDEDSWTLKYDFTVNNVKAFLSGLKPSTDHDTPKGKFQPEKVSSNSMDHTDVLLFPLCWFPEQGYAMMDKHSEDWLSSPASTPSPDEEKKGPL